MSNRNLLQDKKSIWLHGRPQGGATWVTKILGCLGIAYTSNIYEINYLLKIAIFFSRAKEQTFDVENVD